VERSTGRAARGREEAREEVRGGGIWGLEEGDVTGVAMVVVGWDRRWEPEMASTSGTGKRLQTALVAEFGQDASDRMRGGKLAQARPTVVFTLFHSFIFQTLRQHPQTNHLPG
jgi:hypothetical protein